MLRRIWKERNFVFSGNDAQDRLVVTVLSEIGEVTQAPEICLIGKHVGDGHGGADFFHKRPRLLARAIKLKAAYQLGYIPKFRAIRVERNKAVAFCPAAHLEPWSVFKQYNWVCFGKREQWPGIGDKNHGGIRIEHDLAVPGVCQRIANDKGLPQPIAGAAFRVHDFRVASRQTDHDCVVRSVNPGRSYPAAPCRPGEQPSSPSIALTGKAYMTNGEHSTGHVS